MSSAGSTRASTKRTEPTKSAFLKAFVMASPSRLQPSSSPSLDSISSSGSRSMPPPIPTASCHSRRMRIASLVPSATESLFALGLGEEVVAVTHECDHPAEALRLPRLTRSVIPAGLEPEKIDAMVREVTGRGDPLYELDEAELAAVVPDLIVTQALCAVCAVSYDDVRAVAGR